MRSKKEIFLSILFFLGGVLIMAPFVKNISAEEVTQIFLILKRKEVFIAFFLTLVASLIGALKWQNILNTFGVKIPFFSAFSLYQGAIGIGYFAPFLFIPAQFLKAGYLKKNYSLETEKGLTSIAIDFISEWAIFILFIIFAFLIFSAELFESNFLFSVTLIFFLLIAIIFLFFYRFLIFKNKKTNKHFSLGVTKNTNLISKTENEFFTFFWHKKMDLLKSFLFSFLKATLFYLRTIILIKAITQHLNPVFSFGVLGLSFLGYLVPIPASLGILEGVQTIAFYSANLQTSQLLAFTTAIRTTELLLGLLGVLLLFKWLPFNWRPSKNQI